MTSAGNLNDDTVGAEFLSVAEKLIEKFQSDARAEMVSIIATRYSKLGLIEHAIDLAETISDPLTRDNTFAEIAAGSITTGTSDYVDSLLEMIDDPSARSMAIEEIAVKYAELGDLDNALELAGQLDDADATLSRVAVVDGSSSARSIELAQEITDPEIRAITLGQLAIAAHRAGGKAEAAELLDEALEASEEIEFSQNRIYALVGMASLYDEVGDTDEALEILSRALEECKDFEGMPEGGQSSSFPHDQALAQIVGGFARLGDFEHADLAAEQIEDPFQFANASSKEALEYFRVGQVDQALTLLSEALQLALDEPVYGEQGMLLKDSLLAELAVAFVIVGQFEKGLQVVKKLSSVAQRNLALEQVGKQCARDGNEQGVFRAAESITNKSSTTSYWLAITDVLRQSAESDLTPRALSRAAQSAATIEDDYERALSLVEVAYRFALTENPAKASELFTAALVTISQLYRDDQKVLSLLTADERFRQLNRNASEEQRQLLKQIAS
jgi:tetratricopeptide (TPR) repeat protein